MEHRRLGKSAVVVSDICMGTMTFGSQTEEAEAHRILDKCLDAGINFFDTAENYPVPPRADYAGRTEDIVGRWMKGKRPRCHHSWRRKCQRPQAMCGSNGRQSVRGNDRAGPAQYHRRGRGQPDAGCRPTISTSTKPIGPTMTWNMTRPWRRSRRTGARRQGARAWLLE
jgi:hypothetical protein